MAVIANENHRLAWLASRLADRRGLVLNLIRKITGFGHPAGLKPSLFNKFLRMLDDVATAKQEESSLISRIEDIEQKHQALRQHKKLKQASPGRKAANDIVSEEELEQFERPSSSLLKLIIVWMLFSRRQKSNQKNQGFTAN